MDENTTPTTPIEFNPPIPVAPSEPLVETPVQEVPQEGGQVETPVQDVSHVEEPTEEKKIEDVSPEVLEEASLDNPPEELAEEKALDLPASFQPHGQWDPTFNCPVCLGEGLEVNPQYPEGRVCLECKGTGKI